MPKEDAWDWALLLYIGTVVLRRSEAAFWKMTPRKLRALVDVHAEINGAKDDEQEHSRPRTPAHNRPKVGFIDQVIP